METKSGKCGSVFKTKRLIKMIKSSPKSKKIACENFQIDFIGASPLLLKRFLAFMLLGIKVDGYFKYRIEKPLCQ